MHGEGIYTWADGRRYQGQYEMDKKHGFGVYQWADGRVYEGFWLNGKQHGQGKYILQDGTVKIGEWVNGKRTHWLNEGQDGGATGGGMMQAPSGGQMMDQAEYNR